MLIGVIHLWRPQKCQIMCPSHLHHPQKWTIDLFFKSNRIHKHVTTFKPLTPCGHYKCMLWLWFQSFFATYTKWQLKIIKRNLPTRKTCQRVWTKCNWVVNFIILYSRNRWYYMQPVMKILRAGLSNYLNFYTAYSPPSKQKWNKALLFQSEKNLNFVDVFAGKVVNLTLSWRRPLSYRDQSIDLQSKSMDWFLCDNDLRHESVKLIYECRYDQTWKICPSSLVAVHFKHFSYLSTK